MCPASTAPRVYVYMHIYHHTRITTFFETKPMTIMIRQFPTTYYLCEHETVIQVALCHAMQCYLKL